MATKKKFNKSEEIRNYAKANPSASAKGIVAALKKKGIDVSAATVATVKSKAGLTKRRKRKTTQSKRVKSSTRATRSSRSTSPMSVELLCAAKSLAVQAGSMDSAIAALRALEKIESVSA